MYGLRWESRAAIDKVWRDVMLPLGRRQEKIVETFKTI